MNSTWIQPGIRFDELKPRRSVGVPIIAFLAGVILAGGLGLVMDAVAVSRAQRQGVRAYRNGLPHDANPFLSDLAGHLWLEGWLDAKEDLSP